MRAIDAIDLMVKAYPEFATANGAVGRCGYASKTFVGLVPRARLLHLRGYRQKRPHRSGWYVGTANPDRDFYHCVVECDGLVIDFTARQLDRHAPYPLIMTKRECRRQWLRVTRRYMR